MWTIGGQKLTEADLNTFPKNVRTAMMAVYAAESAASKRAQLLQSTVDANQTQLNNTSWKGCTMSLATRLDGKKSQP